MALVYLRRAKIKDIKTIYSIINSGRKFLEKQNINQWQGNYPSMNVLRKDIYARQSYVLTYNGQIAGVGTINPGLEPTYLNLSKGKWINGTYSTYVTIHRFAISSKFRGHHLSSYLMSALISVANIMGYHDIRGDTHPDNKLMQQVLDFNRFKKVGLMYVGHHSERWVYQLAI